MEALSQLSLKWQDVSVQRQAVVDEALTWLRTPYISGQMVKGAGCDCLTLLAGTFINVGLVAPFPIPRYSADWFFNQSKETYLEGLLQYCIEQEDPSYIPQPGDALLWKFGNCYSHGALVLDYPQIIHAYVGRTCGRENLHQSAYLQYMARRYKGHHYSAEEKPMKVFTFKEWM